MSAGRLTDRELSVLRALEAGLSRCQVARRDGVSRAAITQTVRKIEAKGDAVHPPLPARPAMEHAAAMFDAGATIWDLARARGFSKQRAYELRRAWVAGKVTA